MLTPKQIELRKHHITGTDMAPILGISPFKGRLTVFAEKKELIEPTEPTDLMERGTFLEDGELNYYSYKTGAKLRKPGTVIHPKHPLIAATPDAVAVYGLSEYRAVEAKCPSQWTWRNWGEEGTDDIPDHYIPQAILEAAVLGVQQTDVIADIGTALRIYPVKYDEELFQMFREESEKFWRDHVEANVPPPAGPADMGTLKRLYPTAKVEDYLEENEELRDRIINYLTYKHDMDSAAETMNAHKAALIQAIGDKSGIIGEFGRIDFKNNKPSLSIDWMSMAKELGVTKELVKKYTREKPGARPFKLYPKKESK